MQLGEKLGDWEQPRVIRENFESDHQNQQIPFPSHWQRNQSLFHLQDNNQIKEGWVAVENWPKDSLELGQVSGVSVDSKGLVYIFHRGDRVWDSSTFDAVNKITTIERHRGPISVPTVIIYNPTSGQILQKWGENLFYLPHGITVDQGDNVWTTDVALHQVFKYSQVKNKPETAELTLGEAFVPGNDAVHFCKPTSVAVTSWGDFFVADGYCNSRILKFDKSGVKISEWGRSTINHGIGEPANYMFMIPHALTLAEDKGLVCTADRENGRVQCFDWHNGTIVFKFHSPCAGSRLFSLAYTPAQGGLFFVVNGPEFKQFPVPVRGCVISGQNHQALFQFGENKLTSPHDIAVLSDGKTIFVVEIDPYKVWKYQSNDVFNTFMVGNNMSTIKSVASSKEEVVKILTQPIPVSPSGILPAILVTAAALLFAGALLIAAIVYSRAKRRGCGQCDGQGWMLGRHPAEGFKLGHFLGQHQGFQKVNTGEESEEEDEVVPFA
ncbi:peptidyl-alpha-hydroxyglycine alpha-amidating lyase 1-like isoform X2 [Lycorma delicatula]|uniref:peptidyl-alpha-hydroxyglycine alpha-amidating lyase 1-like isoform X2 n=1 Tax=Lycorma delicatula TaxID=130591 RepID=UPI003F51662D